MTVAKVGSDATTSAVTDAAQSDLVTSSNGSIVLQSAAGTITLNDGTAPANGIAVNANGTGNVLIQAQGAGTDVLANANAISGSGNITVLGARNVTFGASDSILTGGGTVDVEAGTGAITFAASSLVSTVQSAASGGAVRMLAATNVTLGGVTAGTANVSVTATSGTIYNAGNGTYAQNVVASGLRLNAGTGVGLSGTHLITSVATLSANAGSGGIFITQQLQAVAINSVAVTVAKVGSDATTSAVTDAAQSDLVTGSNGSIVLQSAAGTITLNDGTAPADGIAVNANGTGNVLIQAQGAGTDVLANANVISGSGNITVLGARNVTFGASDSILTGGGTVDVEAGTGAITFAASSLVSTVQSASSGGAVRMLAATDATLGGVTAGTANVSVTATSGTIYNAGNGTYAQNVVASGLRLNAGTGAGTSGTHLITSVATLSASAGSGGIFITQQLAAVAVDSVAVTVNKVGSDATTSAVTDAAQSDLVTGSNGSIVLQSTAGTITLNDGTAPADGNAVNANGAGEVLIQAQGAGTSVVANASVVSEWGDITILGAAAVTFNATGTSILTGGGTVDVEAGTGAITFDASSLVSTVQNDSSGSAVRMLAATNVTLGGVTAGTANVSVTATSGTIYNAGNGTYAQNVVASGLRLNAGTGVGPSGTHLLTAVATLSA